ncbi:MAG: MBOAT family protein [Clostridia bacterium]|nr:MBOAT family protein [Clostridia bacterium]
MLFSSIPFLYYFLPCVLITYFISPRCLKNTVLLLFSLVFYGWGEPKLVLLMVISILIGYISGLLIEKFRGTVYSKISMILGVVIAFSFLIYYKYANFFVENFGALTGISVPVLKIALPIGISFYTFQIVSYIIDVYRADTCAQKNIINLAAYIAMFPQLIAGPIVRYVDVERQLRTRVHTVDKLSLGIRRFVLGLAKKILVANALGELCDIFRETSGQSVVFAWIYGIAFSLHIYFDFSGYSDMAIGLGHMFGFNFLENFNYPYVSVSVTEFWRRWHMSLGSWFRDYLYIPLGGNRVKKRYRWFINIFIVWLATGFWHGAAWNFIIWGLMFGVLLVIEKLWLLKHFGKHKVLSRIYVLFVVMISFIIFNASSMSQAWNDIISLFGFGNLPFITTETLYYLRSYALIFIIAFIGATPFMKNSIAKIRETKSGMKIINTAEPLVLAVLLIIMTSFLVDGSFNPFLYFRF